MRKVYFAGGAFAAAMTAHVALQPALAADVAIEPAAVYVERPPIVGLLNWTGFYIGANLGYARTPGSDDVLVRGATLLSLSENMRGVIGGAQVGGNWQTGNGVFGLEADIEGTSQSVSSSSAVTDFAGAIAVPGAFVTASNKDNITSFGSVRGRVGVASDRWLIYATGGWAYFNWTSNLTVSGVGTANFSGFQGGGAAGLGVETLITGNWTMRAEYLYLQSTAITTSPFVARPDITVNNRFRENVFRIGVNYVFFTGSVGCRPHVC